MRAAISLSLRARSRRENYFRKSSSIWTTCWSYVTLSSGTSAVISCASVIERIHSSSSNSFVVGPFSFFRNMSCVLRRNRHSGNSPIAHLIVGISRPRNRRLLCPGASEGYDCFQMFLTFTCGARCTHGRNFDVRQ